MALFLKIFALKRSSYFVLAVDEQNAQTRASTSSLAEAIVTVAASAAGGVVTTSTATMEEGSELVRGLFNKMTTITKRGPA